jgi:hypothetical protein
LHVKTFDLGGEVREEDWAVDFVSHTTFGCFCSGARQRFGNASIVMDTHVVTENVIFAFIGLDIMRA